MATDTIKAALTMAVTALILMGIWVYQNRCTVVAASTGESTRAYKLNRLTGEVWIIVGRKQILVEPNKSFGKDKDPLDLFPELKK